MKCVSLGLGQNLGFLDKMHQGMLRQGLGGEVRAAVVKIIFDMLFFVVGYYPGRVLNVNCNLVK